ncbi:MAG: amidohydrolase family protein, partial [Bryobacteraceae bacterium]
PVEASGKTLIPGLVDMHIHLASPGGMLAKPDDYKPEKTIPRALAAYLYSGVTAVRSMGDPVDEVLKQRAQLESGENLGTELFVAGPMFTTPGGHGTEYTKRLPENIRAAADAQLVRLPKTPDEARQMVRDLKAKKVDLIKAILESGVPGMLYNRMDLSILRAIADEARKQGLPLATHTGDSHDVADAIEAGTRTIEHGSMRDIIPDTLFEKMKQQGIAYDPTLSVAEAFVMIGDGKMDLLERSLVQQVGPPALLETTKKWLTSPEARGMGAAFSKSGAIQLEIARKNLKRAWELGVPLITGSDAGNMLVIHGPTVHRELQLWVEAGLPQAAALQAATFNAAKALGAEERFGRVRKGLEATFVLVDGDPLKDISVTERISLVLFKGERINRPELFEQN